MPPSSGALLFLLSFGMMVCMNTYQNASIAQANRLLQQDSLNLIDIRDPESFGAGHISGAENIFREAFNTDTTAHLNKSYPTLLCCYHGNSSKVAAQWLVEQGFEEVYSLDGGYEAWREHSSA